MLHKIIDSFVNNFPSVPPEIMAQRLREQTVITGKEIVLPVNFESIPSPSIVWNLNDKVLSKSDRIIIEEIANFTEVRIRQAQKSDAGTYKVILSNLAGRAETSFTVYVNGNAPTGSLYLILTFNHESIFINIVLRLTVFPSFMNENRRKVYMYFNQK